MSVAARRMPPVIMPSQHGAPRHARIPYERCPLCDHEDATTLGTWDCVRHPLYKSALPRSMQWLRCDACEHVFVDGYFGPEALATLFGGTHPGQTPGDAILAGRAVSAKIVEDVAQIRRSAGAPLEGRWLDVGFGAGALLAAAEELGFDVVGLDLRADTVARMRNMGYAAHCEDLVAYAPEKRFDVISMADVLEHMPFPKPALARAHALLEENGLLFLSMPNLDSFAWRALHVQGRNPYWTEIEHLHNFGRRRLVTLLRESGFEPCRYGISDRYVASMEIIARRV